MAEQKKSIGKEKILQLFDRYDDSKACGFITDYAMLRIKHIPKWEENLILKIKKLKAFVGVIQSQVNMKYAKSLGSKFSIERNLFFYTDPSMPQIYTKLRIMQNSNHNVIPVSLNIPLNKLLRMPALEVYALLSASVHSSIKSMLSGKEYAGEDIDLNNYNREQVEELLEEKDNQSDLDRNKKRAHKLLSSYLEGFLEKTCEGKLKEFDNVASLISAQIIEELPPKDIDKMLEMFFDMSTFNDEAV